jgi:hypothetical protein
MTIQPPTTGFLPAEYEVPQAGGHYMKLKQGDNTFRILSSALLGYLDWKDNKPVRYPYTPDKKPKPFDPKRSVKHFWAFPVWNYKENAVQILEITQSGIQNDIYGLAHDEAWGSPLGYDICIKKQGEGLDTVYNTIARPPKPLAPEIKKAFAETPIDLSQLLKGGDPFGDNEPPKEEFTPDEIVEDNMNF